MMKTNVYLLLLIFNTLFSSYTGTTEKRLVKNMNHRAITIYSGACKLYKREFVKPNNVKWSLLSEGFAKIIIDKSSKKLSFHFRDKMIFSKQYEGTYIDSENGIEGFTFMGNIDGSYSGTRMIAENDFLISYSAYNFGNPNSSLLGYQYELKNYKIN